MAPIKAILLASILLLAGCTEDHEPTPMPEGAGAGRFKLEKQETFRDYDAFNDKRSVYILTDMNTGEQWIGISGIGISELGQHKSGKHYQDDER